MTMLQILPTISRTRRQNRRGLAVVEFAICAPLLLILVFGTIEVANFMHFRQITVTASYETALRVSAIGGTEEEATAQGKMALAGYGIDDATISFSPRVDANTPTGTFITVTVSISRAKYVSSPLKYFQNSLITSTTTMMRL